MKLLKLLLVPLAALVMTTALPGSPATPTAAPKAAAGVDWWRIVPTFTNGVETGADLTATWGAHSGVRVWIHCENGSTYYGPIVTYAGAHSVKNCPYPYAVSYPYHGFTYVG